MPSASPPRAKRAASANRHTARQSASGQRARHRLLTRAAIETLFGRLAALDPEPRTELLYASNFQLLVAVVLSAQATDVGVNKVTRVLFARAPTPAAVLALGESELARIIGSLGLFRTKARNVIALCRLLLERHDGAVPNTRAALEALPGVGRKTANVVLNVAFGAP
ncbi:MAG: endonuclease III, partial [Pseudomonadota bacterium]|nr:endonuclease III [Pseudomonadota bacterium]